MKRICLGYWKWIMMKLIQFRVQMSITQVVSCSNVIGENITPFINTPCDQVAVGENRFWKIIYFLTIFDVHFNAEKSIFPLWVFKTFLATHSTISVTFSHLLSPLWRVDEVLKIWVQKKLLHVLEKTLQRH